MTTVRVGYIPYLNMAPFHQGFGPEALESNGIRFEFPVCSPRMLGLEAEAGRIDAGAFSLVDSLRLSETFEPVGSYGIGVKGAAQSVLVFSKQPFAQISGVVAVTDETATSIRLLEMLLTDRYGQKNLHFGRIASSLMFDGEAEAVLLIGDDALRTKKTGLKGLPYVTDLGQEWLAWKKTPFVFARWMVRKALDIKVKHELSQVIEKSLNSNFISTFNEQYFAYISGFCYRLTSAHEQSIDTFKEWYLSHVS